MTTIKHRHATICGLALALATAACGQGIEPDNGDRGRKPTTGTDDNTTPPADPNASPKPDDTKEPEPPPAKCDPGLPSSLADVASLATDDTRSDVTPMGTRFEEVAKHKATAAELSFLADATKSPPIPKSTPDLRLRPYPVTLYPSGKPTPADVNQHAIGDCNGDTAMASLAYQNPAFIQRIITDNHDGTFTVAMFDPMGKPIKVGVDSQFLSDGGGIGAVTAKNGSADWATVLEKAVMKYDVVFDFIDDIEGIGSEQLAPLLTGDGGSIAFDRGVLKPDQLTRVVTASLAAGKFISGGFGKETPLGQVHSVTAHGYAVLIPPQSVMVSMRNPWGVNPMVNGGFDPSTDGVLDIPVDDAWARDIDIRIIDPGTACGPGSTKPYVPTKAQLRTDTIRIVDRRHVAHRLGTPR